MVRAHIPALLLAALGPVGAGASEAPAEPPAFPGAEIAVPGGTFHAGARVGPLSDTTAYYRVSPFLLDRTEVTVAQYGACVRAGRCTPAGATVRWHGLPAAEAARWAAACNGDRADRADHPVNCVDAFQADAYCASLGKRLPTEEEWEWAARGGRAAAPFPWGDAAPGDRACWSGSGAAARVGTCPVASHPAGATPSGLQDLAGNVWEWTATRDAVFTDSRGRGGVPARIARGGGWADDQAERLSVARRAKDLPGDRAADVGFRCARDR
jgi:formylglycine-generating enzyme required for sulfatase activity